MFKKSLLRLAAALCLAGAQPTWAACPDTEEGNGVSCSYAEAVAWASSLACSGKKTGLNHVYYTGDPLIQDNASITGRAQIAQMCRTRVGSTVSTQYDTRAWTWYVYSTAAQAKEIDDCDGCGHRVKTGSGEEYHSETHLEAGRLSFAMHYSSSGYLLPVRLGQVSYVFQSDPWPFWSHSFAARISAGGIDGTVLATAVRADLSLKRFGLDGWEQGANARGRDHLTRTTDAAGATTGWILLTAQGVSEHYDATGLLARRVYPDGYEQVLAPTLVAGRQVPQSVVDSEGRALVFGYDPANGRLITVQGPDGRSVAYEYHGWGNLTKATFPTATGTATRLYAYGIYMRHRTLTAVTDENGTPYLSWEYDGSGRVTGEQLAGAQDRRSFTYEPTRTLMTTPAGAVITFNHALVGKLRKNTSTVRPCPTCPGGSSTLSRTYDANGFPDVVTGHDGVATDYNYNARGLVVQKVESANHAATRRTTQTDWHASLALPTEQRTYDSSAGLPGTLKARSSYGYNARGQVTATCEIDPGISAAMAYACGSLADAPAGVRQSRYTYCEDANACGRVGLLLSVDGPRTDVADLTTYTYRLADDPACATTPTTCAWRQGDPWKITNALNHVTEITSYDGAGRVRQSSDANGVVTDYEYHPRGWLLASKVRGADSGSETDDAITRLQYDAAGQVTRVTSPDGDWLDFDYDDAHRLTDISDALGNTIHYTLDAAGNRVQEETKDPSGAVTRRLSRLYNSLSQLQTAANASATPVADIAYDANGDANTVTDALGRVSDQDTDGLGRLVKAITNTAGTGAERAVTEFGYDALDRLTTVTDPKALQTSYVYDGLGNQSELHSPDTGISLYVHDAAGNRTRQTDARGVVTDYAYDALGRLTTVSYPGDASLDVGYQYDTVNAICAADEAYALGRLTRMQDASGETLYCYDRFGRLARKQQVNGGVAQTLAYRYTLGGRLQQITYPSGMVVSYAYDAAGQATQVSVDTGSGAQALVQSASHLPFGPLRRLEFGLTAGCALSPLVQTRSYDLDYAPLQIGGLDYSVDAQGRILAITDPLNPSAPGNAFEYDGQDRLTAVKTADGSALVAGYGYDATGNRLEKTDGVTPEAYAYASDSHRLASVAGTARAYDAAGNLVDRGDRRFVYGDHGRMSEARDGNNALLMAYAYNGRGERVRKYLGTSSTRYLYGEGGQLLVQARASGATQEIIWLDSLPVGLSQDGTLHGVLADHLGTPRQVFELDTQQVVWAWSSQDDAFGEGAVFEDGVVVDLRLPGQVFDAETRLHYNYFRDYEPGTGRYIESDPIGLGGGISTYGYVGGEPLTAIDPFGLADIRLEGNSGNIEASERLPLEILNSECKAVAFGNYALDWVPLVGFLLDIDDVTRNEYPNLSSKFGALGTTIGAGAWTYGYLAPAWQNQVIEDMRRRPGTAPRVAVLERRRDAGLRPANRWKVGGKLLIGLSQVIATYEYYQALEECECRANRSSQ